MFESTKDYAKKIIENGWKLTVDYDEWLENPLSEWSLAEGLNIALFHNRYRLFNNTSYDHRDYNSWNEMENAIMDDNKDIVFITPVYMYDHTCVSLSTNSFSCRFDSGKIGFIWITKKDAENHKFENYKKIVSNALQVYEDYINNVNMYWYGIEKNGEMIDSLGGIYLDDISELKQFIIDNADVNETELDIIKELTESLQF